MEKKTSPLQEIAEKVLQKLTKHETTSTSYILVLPDASDVEKIVASGDLWSVLTSALSLSQSGEDDWTIVKSTLTVTKYFI